MNDQDKAVALAEKQEPVAWRYESSNGTYRYCKHRPNINMAKDYSILNPAPLYTHPPTTPALVEAAEKALATLETYESFVDDAHIIDGQWHWLDGANKSIDALRAAIEAYKKGLT